MLFRIIFIIIFYLLNIYNLQSADIKKYACKKNELSFNVYVDKAPYYQVVMPNQNNSNTKYAARVKKIRTQNGEDFQLKWATTNYNQTSGTLVYYVYYQVMGVLAYSTSELSPSDIKLLKRNSEIDKQRTGRYKLKEEMFNEKFKAKKTKTYSTKCN